MTLPLSFFLILQNWEVRRVVTRGFLPPVRIGLPGMFFAPPPRGLLFLFGTEIVSLCSWCLACLHHRLQSLGI